MHTPTPQDVLIAQKRIAPYVHRTPLLSSRRLNALHGHNIVFKCEMFQRIGAFKVRGAFNALLRLQEKGALPQHIVTLSSGNHAQATALAGQTLGARVTVFAPAGSSAVKMAATASYGAEVILTADRAEAEAGVAARQAAGAFFLPPYDHDDILVGQGTSCLEALQDGATPDAVFATCGGGGWLSGTQLAVSALRPSAQIFAGEPLNANDAAQSYRAGRVVTLQQADPPARPTIADGARSGICERTFAFLRNLAGFYEIDEADIIRAAQTLMHTLKITVEPTSAVAFAAAIAWMKEQTSQKQVLVLLSGGNVDAETQRLIWQHD